jgi:hypothetical protein
MTTRVRIPRMAKQRQQVFEFMRYLKQRVEPDWYIEEERVLLPFLLCCYSDYYIVVP